MTRRPALGDPPSNSTSTPRTESPREWNGDCTPRAAAREIRAVAVEPPSPAMQYLAADAKSLRLFVNRYLRTRGAPNNRLNRGLVQDAVAEYPTPLPARCSDVERFLDESLLAPQDGSAPHPPRE